MPQVAYIVSRFPKLTETFVLDEVLEMERLGVRVVVYPLLGARERVEQPGARQAVRCTRFVPYASVAALRAWWHFVRRSPLKILQAWWEVLTGTFGSLKFFAGAVLLFPRAVCYACDAEREEIEHVHAQFASHAALAALVVHRLTGIPFSFTGRGSDIHVDRTMLERKVAAASFAIAVSESNRQVMAAEPSLRQKIVVVYGGIDTERFAPRARSDAVFRILCVSRFEPVKGHRLLLDACRRLESRGLEFECHLVGDGELRAAIERRIAESGLGERVVLHGARAQPEVLHQLWRASVFVLATDPPANGKREGIPNVLKEAMACALPVVATDVSGIPELITHRVSGILVPARDVDALAGALQELAADDALRDRLGRAARDLVVDRFDIRASTRRRAVLFLQARSAQRPWVQSVQPRFLPGTAGTGAPNAVP